MALATILETLDGVAENLATEYKETEIPNVGKRFVLDLSGVEQHPSVRNLKTAFEATKTSKSKLQQDLDAANMRIAGLPDDFDPAEFQRLKDAAADGKGAKVDERLAKQREELEKKHQIELAKKDERLGKVEQTLRSKTIDDGLTGALIENGIDRKHLPVVKAFLATQVKVKDEDGTFTAYVETDIDPTLPVSDFVKGWAASEAGKVYVSPATGGGANGGTGKALGENPWDTQGGKVKPNLTKQQELVATQPERARQLAIAAGQTPNW